jgi:glycerophosphoryl diester phosphodiesterase
VRFSPQLRALNWLVARPIAHRGLHDEKKGIVENTEAAFAAAIKHDYAIECDIQLTEDGEAVVFHDEELKRVTESKGLVIEHTVSQLKKLKYRQSKAYMQTLTELLEQVDGSVPLVIEIKTIWDGGRALTLRALENLRSYKGPYALMSFDPGAVALLAEVSPHTVRGMTADRGVDDYYKMLPIPRRLELQRFSHVQKTRPHFVSFNFKDLPFAPVQGVRAMGFPVITWTIKNKKDETLARRYSDQVTFEGYHA